MKMKEHIWHFKCKYYNVVCRAGRMALLVTLFLVLVNIFNSVTANSPKAEGSHYHHLKQSCSSALFVFSLLHTEMMITCWKVSLRWRPGWCLVSSTCSECWPSTLSSSRWSRAWRGGRRRRRRRSREKWGNRLSRSEGQSIAGDLTNYCK